MAQVRCIAYYRVSTAKQGQSGLGLDAQREAVRSFLNGGDWTLPNEFTEVESGKVNDRPQLVRAVAECRPTGATLIIAKLDRLSRNTAFLLNLRDAGVDFVAADRPNANRLTIGILAVVAENEREMISVRTKAALAAATARGQKLGGYRTILKDGTLNTQVVDHKLGRQALQRRAAAFAAGLGPIVAELHQAGRSPRQIAVNAHREGHPNEPWWCVVSRCRAFGSYSNRASRSTRRWYLMTPNRETSRAAYR